MTERHAVRAVFGSITFLIVASAGPRDLRADTITSWVQAMSIACICEGHPWDIGSPEANNSGQQYGVSSVSEISGPYTDNYPGSGGSQYAEGWSTAYTSGVLKAFSQVDDTGFASTVADGHSYWGATILATCDPTVPGTQSAPNCATSGKITYNFGIQLHDTLTAGTYTQYGGAFVNYDGAGALAALAIHDAANAAAPSLTLYYQYTATVGSYFDIGADLTAQTQATNGYAKADASSTGLFSLQVLTPGGGYASSGAQFATSFDTDAPEPGTSALFAFGCLCLRLLPLRKLRNALNVSR